MPNAQQSFVLLWKRVVAALSLVAAALLAPTAAAPVSGAGISGSRVGHGPAIANAVNALIASADSVADDGRPKSVLDRPETSGPHGKPFVAAVWHELPAPRTHSVAPLAHTRAPIPAFVVRSGHSRAPPTA